MVDSNERICSEYRTAKSKLKQIGILAELNGCTKDEIKQILVDAGEKLPGNMTVPGQKKAPKPAPATKPETPAEKTAPSPAPALTKRNELAIYHQAIATIGDIILLSDRGGCDDIKEAIRGVLYMVFAATEGK